MSVYRIAAEAAFAPTASRSAGWRTSQDQSASGGTLFQAIVDRLTKWIPSEVLVIYVPAVTLLAAQSGRPSAILLIVMILVTPLFAIGVVFATGGKIGQRVWVSAILGTVAFAIWSMSVPLSGWQRLQVIADNAGGFAVGAAIGGALFAFFAEGILRRLGDERSPIVHTQPGGVASAESSDPGQHQVVEPTQRSNPAEDV